MNLGKYRKKETVITKAKLNILALCGFAFFAQPAVCLVNSSQVKVCESSKEFLTVLEYLKSLGDASGSGISSVKVATQTIKGCTGAAKRFIQAHQTLSKSELSNKDVLEASVAVAQTSDEGAKAFSIIFQRLYSEDGFDLSIEQSLKTAKKLAMEFKKEPKFVGTDFNKIADFCETDIGLRIPKAHCVDIAEQVALSGSVADSEASGAFIQVIKFFQSEATGPGLNQKESIETALKLVQNHPKSVENYLLTYQHSVAEKGLSLNKKESHKLAMVVALETGKLELVKNER